MFLPHPRVKVSIVGSLRDREVACSASDRQGSNFESCVWRTVSSHHPQEVLLAQFSLYVHKGGLKPDSFHFIFISQNRILPFLDNYMRYFHNSPLPSRIYPPFISSGAPKIYPIFPEYTPLFYNYVRCSQNLSRPPRIYPPPPHP